MSLASSSSLAQEYSELEKKLSLEKDKVCLLEDQRDIWRQEKEEMQQKVSATMSFDTDLMEVIYYLLMKMHLLMIY